MTPSLSFQGDPVKMFKPSKLLYLFVCLALGYPTVALAQDDGAAETEQGQPSASANAAGDDAPTLDPSDELYWAKMRDIYTYQRKGHRKDGRFAIAVYTGIIPNNIFEQYVPFGLRLNYYFLENVGIEVAASYDLKISTSLSDEILNSPTLGANGILLGDSQVSHSNVGILWSPLYGKAAWYDATIKYFDVYLFGGAGLAIVQTQENFGVAKPSTEAKVEGAIGAGVNFFLGEHTHLRIDYRQFIFAKVGGGVAIPSEVSLAFGWMF